MAALIRSSYHGAMTLPNLQSSEPLEILAEIGIEKLRRDYQNTFIGEKAFFSFDSNYYEWLSVQIESQQIHIFLLSCKP